jgi:hypothetical protein
VFDIGIYKSIRVKYIHITFVNQNSFSKEYSLQLISTILNKIT